MIGPLNSLSEDNAATAKRIRMIGRERDRLVVARQRLVVSFEQGQYAVAGGERADLVRPYRQRPLVTRQRVVPAPQPLLHDRQEVQGLETIVLGRDNDLTQPFCL